jgi:hypothetical protein
VSDLVLNVRQIMQYPLRSPVQPADVVLLQTGGLGGPYAYASVAGVTGAAQDHDVGRNYLHNARFNIQQRGVGAFTVTNSFTADRWLLTYLLDAEVVVNLLAASDTARSQVGDEWFQNYASVGFTGNSGASSFTALSQGIENVRRLGGKTVTVSFWALGAGLNLGVSLDQVFGSGTGASARVNGTGIAVALTGVWARYMVTLTLPSTAGKTVGPNSDDRTYLNLWFSAGNGNAALSGGVGVQAGTIGVSGVQLEVGPAATTLEAVDPQQELAKCQRYYQLGQIYLAGYSTAVSSLVGVSNPLITTMRVQPTATIGTDFSIGVVGARAVAADGVNFVRLSATTTGTAGSWVLNATFNASADL